MALAQILPAVSLLLADIQEPALVKKSKPPGLILFLLLLLIVSLDQVQGFLSLIVLSFVRSYLASFFGINQTEASVSSCHELSCQPVLVCGPADSNLHHPAEDSTSLLIFFFCFAPLCWSRARPLQAASCFYSKVPLWLAETAHIQTNMSPTFDRRSTSRNELGAADHEAMRGRKRDRSMTRTSVKVIGPDESSTLRGRSRRRANSPLGYASRNTSPSLISPTRQRMLYDRLRGSRREHCPSRPVSPSGQERLRRRRRTRTRSRGPKLELDLTRSLDLLSSLRNEVRLDEDDTGFIERTGAPRQ